MSIYDSIRKQFVPITPEGYPFIGAFAFASLVLFWIWAPLGWIGTILTVWCTYFFRDPPRVTPVREGLVVSPADGRVSMITTAAPPHELGLGVTPMLRISVFMSVFDCHVNRSPVAGRVEKILYSSLGQKHVRTHCSQAKPRRRIHGRHGRYGRYLQGCFQIQSIKPIPINEK